MFIYIFFLLQECKREGPLCIHEKLHQTGSQCLSAAAAWGKSATEFHIPLIVRERTFQKQQPNVLALSPVSAGRHQLLQHRQRRVRGHAGGDSTVATETTFLHQRRAEGAAPCRDAEQTLKYERRKRKVWRNTTMPPCSWEKKMFLYLTSSEHYFRPGSI